MAAGGVDSWAGPQLWNSTRLSLAINHMRAAVYRREGSIDEELAALRLNAQLQDARMHMGPGLVAPHLNFSRMWQERAREAHAPAPATTVRLTDELR